MSQVLWIILVSIGMGACATFPVNEGFYDEKGVVLFSDAHFSGIQLESKGLAVLPMAGNGVAEGIRENAIFEVQYALGIYFPNLNLVTKAELLDQAKRANLVAHIQTAVDDYERDGQLNHPLLNQLTLIENTRYLLYLRVKAFKDLIHQDRVTKQVELEAEVWDAECKKVVWLGVGKAKAVDPVGVEASRVEDVFVGAARNLVAQLTLKKNNSQKPERCIS